MYRFRLILTFACFLFLTTLASGQAMTTSDFVVPAPRHSIQNGDVERFYRLYVPSTHDAQTPVPLVIALHSTATSSASMEIRTGLDTYAEAQGFIVAYPETHGKLWNDGRTEAGLSDLGADDDDLAFLTALIDELRDAYAISDVHLVGEKGGGLMAYRMACQMPEAFKTVSVVGPLAYAYHDAVCPTDVAGATDLLIVHGGSDGFFRSFDMAHPLRWQSAETYTVYGVDNTLSLFADRFGCPTRRTDFATNTIQVTGCADDHTITYYRIEDGVSEWIRNGDYTLNRFGIDVTEIVVDFMMGRDDFAMAQTAEITDHPRSYNVYVPDSYDPTTPTPMVFVLHGRPSNGAAMAFITDMSSVADDEGFIVVYPDAQYSFTENEQTDRFWGYTRNSPFFMPVEYDDTQYLIDLTHDLSLDFNVDLDRIYATGFSNGGFMTHRLACDAPDHFAAFAPVGATAFAGMDGLCDGTEPVPLLYMHGTRDVSVPWQGLTMQSVVNGELRQVYSTWPVESTVSYWLGHNGCTANPTEEMIPKTDPEQPTEVWVYRFECDANGPIEFWGILGGGHNWPGVPDVISDQIAGDVNVDIHASEVIWDFFTRHKLSDRK